MKKIIALILLSFTFFSCNKGQILCNTPPENILIRIIDKYGKDLLDPGNLNGYKMSDISLFYMDGDKKVYSEVELDSIPDTDFYYLKTNIAWNADKGKNFSLRLSETVTDNIYLRYDRVSEDHCSFFRFKEFKYNNVVYNKKKADVNSVYFFEITK